MNHDPDSAVDGEAISARDVSAQPSAAVDEREPSVVDGERSERGDVAGQDSDPAADLSVVDGERSERGDVAGGDSDATAVLESDIAPTIEAVLLVLDQPTAMVDIARAVGIAQDVALEHLHSLQAEYDEQGRGFQLLEAAGGWRLYTRDRYAAAVERFVLDGQKTRLTQAALETLAVIAYRQPVTRARVSAIRGVNVDGVVRTLLTRELIEEAGHEDGSGGGLLSTTGLFLEKLGLRALDELPPIAPLLPDVDSDMDERLESGLAELAGLSDVEMD